MLEKNQLVNFNESFLILSSNENYLKKYYDALSKNNYNIVIINFDNLNYSENWNPFDYPYYLYKNGNINDSLKYIKIITNELFIENNNSDPFWDKSAADLFTGCLLGLFEDAKQDEINFSSIYNMINLFDSKYKDNDYITEYFNRKNKTSNSYKFASSIILASQETKKAIFSITKLKLKILTEYDPLINLLNTSSINLNEIFNKKTAIFIINKKEKIYINNLVTIFINSFYNFLKDNNYKNIFSFILDDIDSLPKINNLISSIQLNNNKNLKFTFITKSKDVFKEKHKHFFNIVSNSINIYEINNSIYFKNKIKKSIINYPNTFKNEIKIYNLKDLIDNH